MARQRRRVTTSQVSGACGVRGSPGIRDLPEALLSLILSQVSLRSRGFKHALVCRAWRDASWQAQASFRCDTKTWIPTEGEMVEELSQFSELRVVQIGESTDAFLESLSQLCPRLEVLEINMLGPFTEASFQHLTSSFPRLRSLRFNIWGGRFMEVPVLGALDSISSLTSLRALHLPCTQSQSIWWLSSLTALAQLTLQTNEDSFPDSVWALRNLRVLHLRSSRATTLSPRIASLTRLTSLYLELPFLEELPLAIGALSSLKKLHIASNWMQSIPSLLSRLSPLEHLQHVGNAISAVEADVGSWPLLRELSLDCPRLTAVSSIALRTPPTSKIFVRVAFDALLDLYQAPRFASQRSDALSLVSSTVPGHLGTITLESAESQTLRPVPSSVAACEVLSLTELALKFRSQTVSLPLGLFSGLRALALEQSKHITRLPDSLGSLISLTSLTLVSLPKLLTLPESLGSLTQLAKFVIRDCNKIGQIPESIGALTALQEVICHGMQKLKCLPDSMGVLQGLREFSLMFSGVKSLPQGFSDLQCLQELHLVANSRMNQVPAVVGNMSSLRLLTLNSKHDISCSGGWLSGLVLLKQLDIIGCQTLMRLPESLGDVSQLLSLRVERCSSLHELPGTLGQLHMLRQLQLRCLPTLEELPESMGELSSLRCLRLERLSALCGLPETLTRLTGLRVLSVTACESLTRVPSLASCLLKLTPNSMEWARVLEMEATSRAKAEELDSLRNRS